MIFLCRPVGIKSVGKGQQGQASELFLRLFHPRMATYIIPGGETEEGEVKTKPGVTLGVEAQG